MLQTAAPAVKLVRRAPYPNTTYAPGRSASLTEDRRLIAAGILVRKRSDANIDLVASTPELIYDACPSGRFRYMAQEDPNKLVEWLLAFREHAPAVRQRFLDWFEAVREEPVLLWHTPAIRYGTYGVGGLILVWVVTGLVAMLVPPPPSNARPTATTADFHVICSDADCGHHFVIHREFGFRGFPVACPACDRRSGMKARPCHSATCQGRWIVPEKQGDRTRCPVCGEWFD